MKMNGVNYSSLLNNTGIFSNQTNKDEAAFTGTITGTNKKVPKQKTAADNRQSNVDRDTFEYSGQTREVTAGYSRPKRTESSEYKALDSNGIQEGIQLSDAAKDLLSELREKYGNMDIAVAEWSSDEEQDYYASLSDKDYSVLINPKLLEKMATDPAAREQYEKILSGAGDKFDTIKEELGDDADKIQGFSITLDKDGNVSYAVKLLKDMQENSNKADKRQQERLEEKRAERKKAEEDRVEKITEKKQETEKIEASSIEELIKKIKEKLHPEQVETSEEM
ncbi:hypothetical protein IMSAGC011_00367 [Lachnospiraceae bacterium]|nr:hypothetical protein IMSAGC011_00367 [Lachnospiraceae bacterium]